MVASVSASFYTLKLSVIPCPPPPTMINLDDEINYLFSEVSIIVSAPATVEHLPFPPPPLPPPSSNLN